MAGAGPVFEKLPVVNVPTFLSDGGKFLKWDDNVASCSVYMVYVDPKGHVLYWRPIEFLKEPEVLCLTSIRDVRTGQYARAPRAQDIRARESIAAFGSFEQEANSIKQRTITIVYGPNMVDLTFINFVAVSVSQAKQWGAALFDCTNNLLELCAPPLRFLECFYTYISVQANQDGEIPAKLLVKQFCKDSKDSKRAHDTLQSAGLASGGKKIKADDFTFEKFLVFYNRLVTRHDIDTVFVELGARKKPYLTTDQFVNFLNNRQRDPRLNEILFPYYNKERAEGFIHTYEGNKTFANQGHISIDGLTNYLMSADNHVLLPSKLQIHQDMTFPITHYFINSSHNTYLTGHQLTGRSSVEIYRQILLAGCRCIELDCWDGKTEELEPVITHGLTLCTEILFKDVIEAINESAFKTTEAPLILSFENHCSARQQLKMAAYCVQIFGDLLLDKPMDETPLEPGVPLPNPNKLKRKILIKNKKRAVKEIKRSPSDVELTDTLRASLQADSPLLEEVPEDVEMEIGGKGGDVKDAKQEVGDTCSGEGQSDLSNLVEGDTITGEAQELSKLDEDDTITEEEGQQELADLVEDDTIAEEEAQQELSDLVNYFQPIHFRGFERAEKVRKCYEMSSFTENSAFNYLKEQPVDFVNYNKFQPSRIYPKGSRVSSDNYMPQLFWNAGCQFVALNFQTLDLPMMLNLGKFEMNGRCGFLLKPEHMRRTDQTFDPFVESTIDGIIAGTVTVKVISAQCLSERRVSTYVEVEMYGLPADTVRRKYRTKVVQNNGLNPIYDEDIFSFKVILPTLAELRLAVFEDNGRLIGHRILPVDGLSPGYRHIKLRNEAYQPLLLPTLFVDIVTKDYVPDMYSEFADALSNPMKYLSEQDKRAQQMEALLEDEKKAPVPAENDPPPVVSSKVGPSQETKIPSDKASKASKPSKPSKEAPSSVPEDTKPASKTGSLPNPSIAPPPTVLKAERPDILDTKPPDIDLLMDQKVYLKLKQKHDNELQAITVKHAKDRALINKDLQAEAKQLKANVEKEKSTVQKRNSKVLKKGGKEGSITDSYNDWTSEISDLNVKHEQEMELLMRNQQLKVKEQFKIYYQEQLDMAKMQVEPKVAELRKILEQIEVKDKKSLDDYHARKIVEVKKEHDKQMRDTVKELTKKLKDKAELQKQKRIINKKFIDQVVKLRQDMKEIQEKHTEQLSKRYEDVKNALDRKHKKDTEELDNIFEEKIAELETQDLQKLVPILIPIKEGQERSNSLSAMVKSKSVS